MSDFIEITASTMPGGVVNFDPGEPGTIAAQLGGTVWCRRCFATRVDPGHVCPDIAGGGRRWVRAGLVPAQEAPDDVLARIDSALADAAGQQPEWRAEAEDGSGFVAWEGSEDAADSTSDDLDYNETCWFCGWEPEPGATDAEHRAYYTTETDCEPHEYLGGAQPEGALVISYSNWYDIDGYPTHSDSRPNEVDEPVWTLYRYMLRTQNDEEGFLDELASGLTVAEARERAASYDGYLLGD